MHLWVRPLRRSRWVRGPLGGAGLQPTVGAGLVRVRPEVRVGSLIQGEHRRFVGERSPVAGAAHRASTFTIGSEGSSFIF